MKTKEGMQDWRPALFLEQTWDRFGEDANGLGDVNIRIFSSAVVQLPLPW